MNVVLERLTARGAMSFADFMRIALYYPQFGYYERKGVHRVGSSSTDDFFTAESIGSIFANLVISAAKKIVGDKASTTIFAEAGAEPGETNVFSHACPPFLQSDSIGRGEKLFSDRPTIVFSNELFDAQPFYRVVRKNGRWRECGVRIEDKKPVEVLLDEFSPPVASFSPRFPDDAPEEYRMDLPLEAESLMRELAGNRNVVAVIAFDYGLDWDDILFRRPGGTARAYSRQALRGDILAAPGEQDITCHIAWDGLENTLKECGFKNVKTERQEAFFMHNSMHCIEGILKRGDPIECGKLRELLHPMRMGEIFQVLTATRD